MIMPYMPSTPAITTGMIDLKMRSDFSTATAMIPTPDFAVPYAEPKFAKTRANAIPIEDQKKA